MENPFEKKTSKKDAERSNVVGRREVLTGIAATIAAVACPKTAEAAGAFKEYRGRYEKGWFYDLDEMENVFVREYNGEKILRNPIRKIGECWVGDFNDAEVEIPDTFLEKTVGFIQEMFDKDYIRFLFRLDANHGHLFVPKESRGRYRDLSLADEAQAMMEDPRLGILFHTAEHLSTKTVDPTQKRLIEKRNFIGWYDGRPLEALPLPTIPGSTRTAADTPGQDLRPYPKFAAHKDGALSVLVDQKPMRFDISFSDNDYR